MPEKLESRRMGPPEREHHQHIIHELGKDELNVAKDLLTVFKKQVTSLARIEALLSDMDDKLDEIMETAKNDSDLAAAARLALPEIKKVTEDLNFFTPEMPTRATR